VCGLKLLRWRNILFILAPAGTLAVEGAWARRWLRRLRGLGASLDRVA
jgi:hypothetical protein